MSGDLADPISSPLLLTASILLRQYRCNVHHYSLPPHSTGKPGPSSSAVVQSTTTGVVKPTLALPQLYLMPNTRLWLESTTQAKPSTKAHEWSHLKSRNQEPPAQDGLRGLLTNQNAFSCPAVTWRTISHLLFFFQSSPSSPRHDSS